MNVVLFFVSVVLIMLIIIKSRRKKKTIILGAFGFVILLICGSCFMYSREEYIQIVNEDNEIVEIRLDNKKEYYGHSFYRFSTDLSEEEILSVVKRSHKNAEHDKENQKIIFNYDGREYVIVKESESELLWYKRYRYIFAENKELKSEEETSNNDEEYRVVQDEDFAYVYDVSKDLSEDLEYIFQYQYFIFNKDKTEIIDYGFMEGEIYVYEKISDYIVKGIMSTGSNSWECVYYNQNTGVKSKILENVLDEFDEFVVFPTYNDEGTYLVVESMFDENYEVREYKIGDDSYIPGLLTAEYENQKLIVEYEGAGKEFIKEIYLSDFIKR